MLLLAWTLFHNAIRYGRRQRIFNVICAHVYYQSNNGSNNGNAEGSICCRLASTASSQPWRLFSTCNTLLRRAPSEPILFRNYDNDSERNCRQIYFDGQREIAVDTATPLPRLRIADWQLHVPSSTLRSNVGQPKIIYFAVRTVSTSDGIVCHPTAPQMHIPPNEIHLLNSSATMVAHLRSKPSLCLYSATLEQFANLAFWWSEGSLFEYSAKLRVDEIKTIPSPFGQMLGREARPRSQCNSVPPIRFEPGASGIELLPARAATSLSNGKARASIDGSAERPDSLLELLFRREMNEESNNPDKEFMAFRRWNSIHWHCQDSSNESSLLFSSSSPSHPLNRKENRSSDLPNYFKKLRKRRTRAHSEISASAHAHNNLRYSAESGWDLTSAAGSSTDSSQISCSLVSEQLIPHICSSEPEGIESRIAENGETVAGEGRCLTMTLSGERQHEGESLHSKWQREQKDVKTKTSHDYGPSPSPASPMKAAVSSSLDQRGKSIAAMVSSTAQRKCSPDEQHAKLVCTPPDAAAHSLDTRRQHSVTPTTSNRRPRSDSLMEENSSAPLADIHSGKGLHARNSLSRSTSLMPGTSPTAISAVELRRRSLSPLTISLLVNYGGQEFPAVVSSNSTRNTVLSADPYFPGKLPTRRVHSTPRRSLRNSESSVDGGANDTSVSVGGALSGKSPVELASPGDLNAGKPRQKPPSMLVYCADNNELFLQIRQTLRTIVPSDTYTISTLTTRALLNHPWMDQCACLIIADTSKLDDTAWARLHNYFVNSGKILFVCENSLLASLTTAHSTRQKSSLLKCAFESNKSVTAAMGKEFGTFLKRALKGLAKSGEINETFYARDTVGGTRFSVVLFKKKEQPMLLYMQNLGQKASALFSDATTEQLLQGSLIRDALHRLGLKDVLNPPSTAAVAGAQQRKALSYGYLFAYKDTEILDVPGLTYCKMLGLRPKLFFQRHSTVPSENNEELVPSSELLPVKVRRRADNVLLNDKFNVEQYFSLLNTKRLGRLLLYVPACETTMDVSNTLSAAFPEFDGILVVAGSQIGARGRSGNDWLSPEGCATFTFNFNIPFDSQLGRSLGFLQHIIAVSIASAVYKLLEYDVPDFPIKLKWPNDIYYGRSYKLGGIIVQASQRDASFWCLVGVGLNVSNSKPTVCINDMLPADSKLQLSVEQVIAMAMNEFERFVNMFEKKGKMEFLKYYYQFWMHSHEEVQILRREDGAKEKVVIRGLDENGYLEVRSKKSGQIMSVMDDGNSFDTFHGLIVPK